MLGAGCCIMHNPWRTSGVPRRPRLHPPWLTLVPTLILTCSCCDACRFLHNASTVHVVVNQSMRLDAKAWPRMLYVPRGFILKGPRLAPVRPMIDWAGVPKILLINQTTKSVPAPYRNSSMVIRDLDVMNLPPVNGLYWPYAAQVRSSGFFLCAHVEVRSMKSLAGQVCLCMR